jgi:hypothetical protein
MITIAGAQVLSINSSSCPSSYTVQRGDTLSLIARHYNQMGYAITWQQIAQTNHIRKPYVIRTGQVLIIPLNCRTTTSGHSTTSSITTFTTISQTSTVSISKLDYQLWVQPYLLQISGIRAVLMTPYASGRGHYGYDSSFGLVRGGNIEASPALGVTNGYQDVIVAIDNNLEGSYSLDYFNSADSVLMGQPGFIPQATNIYGNDRVLLSKSWDGVGSCSSPFVQYNYPSSFSLLDRREAEYGFIGPYASILASPGNHLGGIGSPTCSNGAISTTSGQVWFLPGYENPQTTSAQPLIATVFPSNQPVASTGNLETLSFYIDQMYMQCQAGVSSSCSSWRMSYLNAMSQYPFQAPRDALHFVQVTRATAAWQDPTLTFNGVTAEQMLQDTIGKLFSPSSNGGALGPDGGLYQSWGGGGSSDTPEPNFQAMVAFDPRMPSWFIYP